MASTEKQKLAAQKYRERHPEKARAAVRKWRSQNIEMAREATRRWTKNNPEKAKASTRAYREANPEKTKEWARNWRQNNPDYEFIRKYGLTLGEFISLAVNQEARCAICSQQGKLVVDHCHSFGNVRGLLCAKCNSALGLLKESPEILTRGAEYLRRKSCSK